MARGLRGLPNSKYPLPRTNKSFGNYSMRLGGLGFPKKSTFDNPFTINENGEQGWVIIGDSTAFGNTPQDNEVSAPQTYSILKNYNAGTATIDPITVDTYNATFGSPWVSFGMSYYYRTGYKICFAPTAVSGSTFSYVGSSNSWEVPGANYVPMRSAAANMVSRLGVSRLRGAIVQCGINDSNNSAELMAVRSSIHSLVNRFKGDFPEVPMYFVNIGKSTSGVTQRVLDIRAMIDELPYIFDNVFVVNRLGDAPFNDYMYDADLTHHSQFMNELNGAMIAKNMAADGLIANTPPLLVYPTSTLGVVSRFSALPDRYNFIVNDLVKYLDDNSYWSGVDSLYMPLMNTEANSLQDWVRGTKQAIPHGGVVWDSKAGYVLDGTDDYLDLNFIPTVDGVNFALNDNTLAAMLLRKRSGAAASDLIGSIGSNTNHRNMIFETLTPNIQAFDNSGTTMTGSARSLKSYSFYSSRRSASNATQFTENGTSVTTGSSASIAQSPTTILWGARNNNSVISAYGQYDVGMSMMAKANISANTSNYRKIRQTMAWLLAEAA